MRRHAAKRNGGGHATEHVELVRAQASIEQPAGVGIGDERHQPVLSRQRLDRGQRAFVGALVENVDRGKRQRLRLKSRLLKL